MINAIKLVIIFTGAPAPPAAAAMPSHAKPGRPQPTGPGGKNTFVICEICDGYIKVRMTPLSEDTQLFIYQKHKSSLLKGTPWANL